MGRPIRDALLFLKKQINLFFLSHIFARIKSSSLETKNNMEKPRKKNIRDKNSVRRKQEPDGNRTWGRRHDYFLNHVALEIFLGCIRNVCKIYQFRFWEKKWSKKID